MEIDEIEQRLRAATQGPCCTCCKLSALFLGEEQKEILIDFLDQLILEKTKGKTDENQRP